MNKTEARELLTKELSAYREWSYDQLCGIVGAPNRTFEVTGPSGTPYRIELEVCWDAEEQGDVRVMGTIDDGGWRAFFPLGESFIKAPNGSFVDEDS